MKAIHAERAATLVRALTDLRQLAEAWGDEHRALRVLSIAMSLPADSQQSIADMIPSGYLRMDRETGDRLYGVIIDFLEQELRDLGVQL